jgi:hypothetical protein
MLTGIGNLQNQAARRAAQEAREERGRPSDVARHEVDLFEIHEKAIERWREWTGQKDKVDGETLDSTISDEPADPRDFERIENEANPMGYRG